MQRAWLHLLGTGVLSGPEHHLKLDTPGLHFCNRSATQKLSSYPEVVHTTNCTTQVPILLQHTVEPWDRESQPICTHMAHFRQGGLDGGRRCLPQASLSYLMMSNKYILLCAGLGYHIRRHTWTLYAPNVLFDAVPDGFCSFSALS